MAGLYETQGSALDELLDGLSYDNSTDNKNDQHTLVEIEPSKVINWKYADRPDCDFGNIESLAEDIKENGQSQPAIVRPSGKGRYDLICGTRRKAAVKLLGLKLLCIVRDDLQEDIDALAVQYSENEQRQSLSDYAKGIHFARLLKDKKVSTQKEMANLFCISEKTLSRYLSFIKIPKTLSSSLALNKLSARTSAEIVSISKKSSKHLEALNMLTEEINDGIGEKQLNNKVERLLLGESNKSVSARTLKNSFGEKIGKSKMTHKQISVSLDSRIVGKVKFTQKDQKELDDFVCALIQRKIKK